MKKRTISLVTLFGLLLTFMVTQAEPVEATSNEGEEVVVGTSGQTKPLNYFDEENECCWCDWLAVRFHHSNY